MDYESIFDVFEERNEHPTVFSWTTDTAAVHYASEDVIYDGILTLLLDPPRKKARRYVLTKTALIKCRVNSRVTRDRSRDPRSPSQSFY